MNFKDKIVIKLGGSTFSSLDKYDFIYSEIASIKKAGYEVVLVHGGGNEISKYLNKLNISIRFINGLRYTDDEAIEVIEMVLSGRVNKLIVSKLLKYGVNPIGLSGKDGNLFKVKPIPSTELGLVGEVASLDGRILDTLVKSDYLPVISPIGASEEAITYNLNADYTAAAIAGLWGASSLCFLTDVDGVLLDVNKPESLLNKISLNEVNELKDNKIITGGMLPKIDCCVKGLEYGVTEVFMLNPMIPGNLSNRILNRREIGTTFYR